VAARAEPSGCSDLSFDGDLTDAAGAVIGTVSGVLTTTTGQGEWTLDTGESGAWAFGSL
jgi:hypothetical protein